MESEEDKAELNAGAIFPPWLAVFLALLIWACVGITCWDFLTGGMSWWTFLAIAVPLVFLGAWFILLVKASIKAER